MNLQTHKEDYEEDPKDQRKDAGEIFFVSLLDDEGAGPTYSLRLPYGASAINDWPGYHEDWVFNHDTAWVAPAIAQVKHFRELMDKEEIPKDLYLCLAYHVAMRILHERGPRLWYEKYECRAKRVEDKRLYNISDDWETGYYYPTEWQAIMYEFVQESVEMIKATYEEVGGKELLDKYVARSYPWSSFLYYINQLQEVSRKYFGEGS